VTTPKQKSGKEEVPKIKGARSQQGVLKEVGPAIAIVFAVMPELAATGVRGAEQPPPRVHSPGTPPLPSLLSGYIIGNLRLLSRPTIQVRHFLSKFLFFFSFSFAFLFFLFHFFLF
jgi:hypothetical protein